jgi:hypothetical protein
MAVGSIFPERVYSIEAVRKILFLVLAQRFPLPTRIPKIVWMFQLNDKNLLTVRFYKKECRGTLSSGQEEGFPGGVRGRSEQHLALPGSRFSLILSTHVFYSFARRVE